jgi:prolyl-tRNA synthetase
MYDTYCRIFQRCGLEYVIVEAESGEMGGSGSHQFTVPCDNGEDTIVYLKDGSYAANMERAAVDPAPLPETRPNVGPTEEVHTPNIGTIEELAKFFRKKPKDMIKTLIYSTEEKTVAVVLRGDHDANNEKITQTVSGKHIELADENTIAKVTGAATGFAGPIGLAGKVDLMLIDHSVAAMIAGIAGANKTDYHISGVVPGRDFPLEGDNIQLIDIRDAVEGDTHNGQPLLFRRGIEVGQVFKLGTKYSIKLDATFLDADGSEKPCLMGCYGIGINRIMASAIELASDKNGIIWPISIAPWEVIVTTAGHGEEVAAAGEKIYAQLLEKGIEVLLDDRDARPGVKFKDADLIGIPVRVTIGQKSLADGSVEIKLRTEKDSQKIALDSAADEVVKIVNSLKEKLNDQIC